MPTCESCGNYAPAAAKSCPTCSRMINPTGVDPLVSDQRRPKQKGTVYLSPPKHGGDSVPITDVFPRSSRDPGSSSETSHRERPSSAEWGKADHADRPRAHALRVNEKITRAEPGRGRPTSKPSSAVDLDSSSVTRQIEMQVLKHGQAQFRILSKDAKESFTSRRFPLARADPFAKTEAASRSLDSFIRQLRGRGWKNIGRGHQWFEYYLSCKAVDEAGTGVSPAAEKSRSDNTRERGAAQKRTRGQATQSPVAQVSRAKRPREINVIRVIGVSRGANQTAAFFMRDAQGTKTHWSKPFACPRNGSVDKVGAAAAVHANFILALRNHGWRPIGIEGKWYETRMLVVYHA